MNPKEFVYKGPLVPRGLRSPLYPMPDYPDRVLRGFENWPEIFRRDDGIIDYRLVSPSEVYCSKCDYLESRFTTKDELLERLGNPEKIECYADFDVDFYKYSEMVYISVQHEIINSILLPKNRLKPSEKPGWRFVFVARK